MCGHVRGHGVEAASRGGRRDGTAAGGGHWFAHSEAAPAEARS